MKSALRWLYFSKFITSKQSERTELIGLNRMSKVQAYEHKKSRISQNHAGKDNAAPELLPSFCVLRFSNRSVKSEENASEAFSASSPPQTIQGTFVFVLS